MWFPAVFSIRAWRNKYSLKCTEKEVTVKKYTVGNCNDVQKLYY